MGDTEGMVLGRVVVYSVMGCPHCVQAKNSLGQLRLPVCAVDMGEHPELWGRVNELTGQTTVPQIFFNSVHVGGGDDLQKLAPEELERLVRLVREEAVPADGPPLPQENQSPGSDTVGGFMCDRDLLGDVVQEFKWSSVIGCQWSGLSMGIGIKACETGQLLLDRKYMVGMAEKGKREEFEVSDRQTAACSPLKAAELSVILRDMILKLFSEYLSTDGKSVDYKAMSLSPVFEHYCELAVQLQRVELLSLTREEKLAFFINTYNALVIHGNLRLGAPTNMWQRYRFFNYVSYLIGGEVFTLQDIENGVLRGNRKGVAQLLRPFSKTDPRLQVALPDAEPLVHFALNCGAKGCPPIKTYTPQDVDSQLRTAAEAFLEDDGGCMVDSEKGEVRLSQIFKWYKADFGGTDEKLLNWILEHMGKSPKRSSLQSVLSSGKIKVSYLPYDWSTNNSH
uniref:DEP domain-containing protein n=1 Tax=Esox lucius TaxID=8010 RepID=A0A3P8XSJ8_ESOLU